MCVAERLQLALATAAAVASPASRRRRPGLITATLSIGTAGQPWGAAEKAEWRDSRVRHRSYADEVLSQLEPLREAGWEVVQYGELSIDPARYPLFALRTREWSADRPSVLLTGGVHGYETSGVQGALLWLREASAAYASKMNILVAPCVSPWGYEHIQRWNAAAVDPNRSFGPKPSEADTEEATSLMGLIRSLSVERWSCHVDLHETTDTDETEFRPAKAARDGVEYEQDTIPDGFYTGVPFFLSICPI